jgi:hypothetical protein
MEFPNGNTPTRATGRKSRRHRDLGTRVASWVIEVAIPWLIPDHVSARLAQHTRDVDDRLERTARRLTGYKFGRGPKNSGSHRW